MDSAPLLITAEPPAPVTGPAAAAVDPSKQDAGAAAPFSAALDRQMTNDPGSPAARDKADAAKSGSDTKDEKPDLTRDAGSADGVALPSLISALALPAMPQRPLSAVPAAPGAPAASTVLTTTGKSASPGRPSAHALAAEHKLPATSGESPAPPREPPNALPRLPDAMQDASTQAFVETHLPSALPDGATREAMQAAREALPALHAESRALIAHAEVQPNNPLFALSDLPRTQGASAASITSSAESTLSPRVGTPEWGDALAQKITWMVGEQHPVAELRVNPPDLGPLEIRLTLSGDDNATASAQFASPHAPVREAIEAALPRLREMLAESGITLGNAAIADGALPRDREDRSSGRTGTAFSNEPQAATALPGTDATRLATVRRNHGLVDIFA